MYRVLDLMSFLVQVSRLTSQSSDFWARIFEKKSVAEQTYDV